MPTDERGMRNDGDRWDPATVIGLKSTDEVLVIGNPAFMPWLVEVCMDVSSVRKPNELVALVREGEKFDKVVLPRESTFSNDLLPLAAALLKNGDMEHGLFVSFPSDDGWSTEQAADFYFPEARRWFIDSTFGNIFLAELIGSSWRFMVNV